MQKRKFHEKQEEELLRRLEMEHDLFYYRMISEPSKTVYDQCNIIRFYECVYEYFMYCEDIRTEAVAACLEESNVLAALYALYLKREDLQVETWEDIELLLQVFVEEHGNHHGTSDSLEGKVKRILSELHRAGGCDEKEKSPGGWDGAMTEAIRIVERITGVCVEEVLKEGGK